MALGNTFGATALSSYGGFWLSIGIVLTPGGFEIVSTLTAKSGQPFYDSFGFFLMVRLASFARRTCLYPRPQQG
jgi:succinate-acetate transporter protein